MTSADTRQTTMLHILHLEDSELDHALVKRALQSTEDACTLVRVETLYDFECALTGTGTDSCHAAHGGRGFDVILADYRLPGLTALDAWALMQSKHLHLPFILLSGAIGESAAVAAIKAGISDYLPKDDLGKLRHVIQRAIEMHHIRLAKDMADAELALSERRLAGFADHLQTAIEQERTAIAREIHDDIGGALAAIRFDLAWLGRHTLDSASCAHIASATAMLQHAIEASQRIMMNLRPAILDQGLEAAIQWLANSFSKRTGIATHITCSLQFQPHLLSKPVQLAAYRTAQEALTNIGKYAQCSQVKIELSDADHVLTLEVTDNGVGILATDFDKSTSYGIRGLRERARTVSGWLDVSSLPSCGTSIILSIPLTPTSTSSCPDDTENPA